MQRAHHVALSSIECVLLPCFNALPDIFAIMNCSVLALSAVFCSGLLTWSADVHCSDTLRRVHALQNNMHVVSTNFAKRLFAIVNMLSNCDVTNSVYLVTMTTIRHCSILEFGQVHTIKQSPRASTDLCTPLRVGLRVAIAPGPRCKGAPRNESHLFQMKYSFEKFT